MRMRIGGADQCAPIFEDQHMRYLGTCPQRAVPLRPEIDDRSSLIAGQVGKCLAMIGMIKDHFSSAKGRTPLVKDIFGIWDPRYLAWAPETGQVIGEPIGTRVYRVLTIQSLCYRDIARRLDRTPERQLFGVAFFPPTSAAQNRP